MSARPCRWPRVRYSDRSSAGGRLARRAGPSYAQPQGRQHRLLIHDLRTPLFALRGYLDGLAQGLADTPEKAARSVGIAREKAATLERLIADLFEYTRLEYLEQPPRREPLQVDALLRRLVDGLQPQATAKGVTLLLTASADATGPGGAAVAGDPHLLTRAVENLLDNAQRHTPVGGRIEVAWRAEPARVAFTVADTGPGIALHDLPHLFTPPYRGEESRNRRTRGRGSGLTIANTPGGGARFTGTLARGARALPDARRRARGVRLGGPPNRTLTCRRGVSRSGHWASAARGARRDRHCGRRTRPGRPRRAVLAAVRRPARDLRRRDRARPPRRTLTVATASPQALAPNAAHARQVAHGL